MFCAKLWKFEKNVLSDQPAQSAEKDFRTFVKTILSDYLKQLEQAYLT